MPPNYPHPTKKCARGLREEEKKGEMKGRKEAERAALAKGWMFRSFPRQGAWKSDESIRAHSVRIMFLK